MKIKLSNTFKNWNITQNFGKTPFSLEHPEYYRYGLHTGIDFGMPKGTPILAPHDGIIVRVNTKRKFNNSGKEIGVGLAVSLWDDKQEIATRYYHMSKINVGIEQKVKKYDIIGYIGNTGLSTGYHLHFELLRTKNGYVINKDNGAGGAIDPFNPLKVEWYV